MTYIVNSLAQYEVHVARYYYKRGAYVAAINRAQQAIADYRDAPALEEALYLLVQSFEALKLPQLRRRRAPRAGGQLPPEPLPHGQVCAGDGTGSVVEDVVSARSSSPT